MVGIEEHSLEILLLKKLIKDSAREEGDEFDRSTFEAFLCSRMLTVFQSFLGWLGFCSEI